MTTAITIEPTPDERELYDEISALASDLWEVSAKFEGLNDDPRLFSVMIFKRLWSNNRGYTILSKSNLSLEANIILRSGVEAAICIAANNRLRDEFVVLMRLDALSSLQGQVKMQREHFDNSSVKDAEKLIRQFQEKIPVGRKSAKLDWKDLAQKGDVPQLYGYHKMLSASSSHVTGFSVLSSVTSDRMEEGHATVSALERKMHLMMMAMATLLGARVHASMIEAYDLEARAVELGERMSILSTNWPGVVDED